MRRKARVQLQEIVPVCRVCHKTIRNVNESGMFLCARCADMFTFPVELEPYDYSELLSPETKKRYEKWLAGELS